ncbi:MAG TPA: N-6 DNA methylase, partial [Methanofastidiosum sp.]|nr:N-6 DNA methylase [Methanofastidiosum sp.]
MIRDAKGWGNPKKYDIVIDIYFNVILTIMPPKTKVKEQGQVFTPKHLVNDILDAAGYTNGNILNKHVIDNSCGDGAFLTEIVRRYISEFKRKNFSLDGAKPDLEKYIHGIEKDPNIFISCIKNLNKISDELNIGQIKWDIINGDSLEIDQYDKKMD